MAHGTLGTNRFQWLLSPYTVIASVILGVGIGIFYKPAVAWVAPLGEYFLALLKMCIVPLVICLVTKSFARLLHSHHVRQYFSYMIVIFIVASLLAGIISFIIGTLFKVGAGLSIDSQKAIGDLLAASGPDAALIKPEHSISAIAQFLQNMFPDNILAAIVNGNNVGVLIFSILLGVSLGFVSDLSGKATIRIIDGLAQTFLKLINGIIYLLPFGLIGIFAKEVSQQGSISIFLALIKLISLIYAIGISLVLLHNSIIAKRLKQGYWHTFFSLRDSTTVAFLTTSSFAAFPFIIKDLEEKLSLEKDKVNVILPMGICLNQQGSVYAYVMLTVFMAQFYGLPLHAGSALIIVVGSIFAAIATSGAPNIAALSILSIVLAPLGLPVSAALILFIPIAQIIDPIMTVVNVYGNCMALSLITTARQDK